MAILYIGGQGGATTLYVPPVVPKVPINVVTYLGLPVTYLGAYVTYGA